MRYLITIVALLAALSVAGDDKATTESARIVEQVNSSVPRRDSRHIDLPVDVDIAKKLDGIVLEKCVAYLKDRGYTEYQLKNASIRWGMKFKDYLLLDIYTSGRGTAESARLIYEPKRKMVHGEFFFGDSRK